MSDEAALAKETCPGAEQPPRAAASSEGDAAVAAAAVPDLASEPVVADAKDPEKGQLAGEEEAPAGVEGKKPPPPPANERASAERSLDEKTTGYADAVVAGAPPPAGDGGKEVAAAGEEDGEDEAGAQYLVGLPRLLLGFGLCVTTFLIGLDQVCGPLHGDVRAD